MQPLYSFGSYRIFKLTAELAEVYAAQIVEALDLIPLVATHTPEVILATREDTSEFHAKWEHSLVALDEHGEFVGVIMGYEREAEGNEQYPQASIYMSDFAVAKSHQKQGLGKWMVDSWLDYNTKLGFRKLNGSLQFSVQTNSAVWNRHVQALYESFGFTKRSTKNYPNRNDIVYELIPKQ
jgi:ribosomal protein S18 acetylase RimI-like enzyme